MATNLATRLLKVLHKGRAVAGGLGFRIYTASRVVRFSGESPRSELGEEETPIAEGNGQPPRWTPLSDEEITVTGLPAGSGRLGPITPAFPGGGTSDAFLRGDDLQIGDKLYFRLKGPKTPGGALYVKHELVATKPTKRFLVLKPVELEDDVP